MSTLYYTGNQKVTRSVYIRTYTVAAAASTISATINSKTETYVVTASDTIATAVANAVNQFNNSLILEFKMVTWTSDGVSAITATGPLDGRQVTVTWGGTSTSSTTTTVAATSPYDFNDPVNYLGGAVPVNGDVLVFENNAASVFYNLAALTTITFTIVRRASHTGTIGLPFTNSTYGFVEFLPRYMECAGTAMTLADNSTGFLLFKSTAATAVTVTITGNGGGAIGSEYIEIWGTPANSIIDINGGTLATAVLGGQTSLATTVLVANGVFRSGPGATLTTVKIDNSQAQLNGAYTTLTVNFGSTVTALQAAAGTTTNLQSGTLNWGSTGTPGAINIFSDGVWDSSAAPAAIAVGTVTINEGGTLNDPFARFTKTWSLVVVGDDNKMTINKGTSYNAAIS